MAVHAIFFPESPGRALLAHRDGGTFVQCNLLINTERDGAEGTLHYHLSRGGEIKHTFDTRDEVDMIVNLGGFPDESLAVKHRLMQEGDRLCARTICQQVPGFVEPENGFIPASPTIEEVGDRLASFWREAAAREGVSVPTLKARLDSQLAREQSPRAGGSRSSKNEALKH